MVSEPPHGKVSTLSKTLGGVTEVGVAVPIVTPEPDIAVPASAATTNGMGESVITKPTPLGSVPLPASTPDESDINMCNALPPTPPSPP